MLEFCLGDGRLAASQAAGFRELCDILVALLHFEYHARLEALKDAYSPFDPDADVRVRRTLTPDEREDSRARFVAELRELLRSANFEELSEDEVEAAFERESLIDIRLDVDFDDFEKHAFFRRGEEARSVVRKSLWGLRTRRLDIVNLNRVVVYVVFKERAHFDAAGRTQLNFEPGSTILKLFQNVPRGDLEMLFPNVEVRMRTVDKLLIGLPAIVSGAVVVGTKLIASLGVLLLLLGFRLGLRDERVAIDQAQLLALGAGLGSFGGYLWKQVSKFKNRKIRFMKALADNLYFKNLDNDAGVFYNLLGAAEEEEAKEAMLGYFFLLTADRPLSDGDLDRMLEEWFASRWDCELDFDVADSLAKLNRLQLVERQGDGYVAVPLEEAKRRLDVVWDNAFRWNGAGAGPPPPPAD
ncbi:MAG: TMEM143 family protein [Acidimicrobiales bacterium]